ncbi:Malate dehydrogenase [Natrinema pellirubrum DSM 15624]|uniref:Dehydrogenase n=2 Tax=Natrinema TaxID=88723 RepID=L0JIS8_NATP1|nr:MULTISPECIES: FAD-dependent oxidoreductase [Natrinema]ELZ18326.1 Malate dehydrogenase [Natrinema thermotolerans DSM 11552]AGB30236.1 putative dehydrogenase [Natrinema pellirubrum DSM 15624]ELY78737.1 Malate dehydrogenase [Natrinema pellirubrum DSM 15624]QCC59099.1 FAD-dependent oxidoreductase [Natrinema thermotolerans]WMT06051.1 FAD-dependent oxidoreductase [Natrinema thermotolerans]
MSGKYDLVIVGGGISGASLLYTTAKFTDIDSIALIEKESEVAAINSHHTNNSQTLHFGDIETNYTLEKAEEVKEGAELLAGYLENYDPDREMHDKRSKMVLGVGEDEVAELEERYHDEGFGDLFPKLRPIDREEIGEIEPKVVEGRDPSTEMLALQTPDGYVVDYGQTTKSFVEEAEEEANVDVFTGTEVTDITPTLDGYTIETDAGRFDCDATVVAAGSHSLQMAKELGYGQDKVLLPIAGSFFLADDLLNGKVYTLQMKKLPFAAVHGDADVHDDSITRFGPTAKLVPALERGRISTVKDFLDVFGLNAAAFLSYANILSDRVLLPYVLQNLVYDLPNVGRKQFLPHVQKVVPSVELEDIERAKGYGGVRPQIVDTKNKSLDMGEAKIVGDDVIFNITPSPGASTCLKNAMRDTHTLLDFLEGDYEFDEEAFREETIDNFPRGDDSAGKKVAAPGADD